MTDLKVLDGGNGNDENGDEDRRGSPAEDTGHRRRISDERDEFALKRDKILLWFGLAIVAVVGMTAIFFKVKNPEIVLAVLAAGAGFLGAPSILGMDERRQRRERR